MRKVFEQIGETFVLEPNFIKFAALQLQFTLLQSHLSFIRGYCGKQGLWFLFSDKFSVIRWKLQYHYCVALSANIHAHFFKMKIL